MPQTPTNVEAETICNSYTFNISNPSNEDDKGNKLLAKYSKPTPKIFSDECIDEEEETKNQPSVAQQNGVA